MGSQDKSPTSTASMQSIKVYRLNEDGNWDDQGTGHVTVYYLERFEDLALFVIDDDNETILLHRISSDDIYRKQEDTIISWRDPELSTELALSFQDKTGCSYIWDQLCNLQRSMHIGSLVNASVPNGREFDETFHMVNNELRELPPVELSTLPLILKIVESGIADQLRVTELILHDQDFFRKLMELFRVCEDLENVDGLHLIFKIVRGIILLNNSQIFEKIFGDELVMDVIGCLEYDPEVPHANHRSFLKEHVVFKEAIPIKDPEVLSRIHQSYRVGYLKDVILPRVLDEGIIATFNSIIHANNAIVISLLKDDKSFIKELFARLKSLTTSTESKRTLVHFLHEFCTLSKSLQMVHQNRLFRDLVSEGIFDIIADVLQSEDHKLVLTGADILVLYQNIDANILCSYVAQQEGVLFGLLVNNMLTDYGDDMHCQFLEIIRSLLESTQGAQRENIVEIFYEKHLDQLIDAITSSCIPNTHSEFDGKSISSDGRSGGGKSVKPEILLNICELLCFCVLQHPLRIKCNFLLNNVIDKVLYLTRRREKYLVVGAVRFVRALISRSDDQRKRLDDRALEKEEEDYFNDDSDEEDSASARKGGTNRAQTRPPALVNGSSPNNPAPRSSRLVDYDDDEDDEDYRPPPKKVTDEEGGLTEFRLKRKLVSKEPEPKRLHRSAKELKPRGVLAGLCSTLSEAVLPNKKGCTGSINISLSNMNQNLEKGSPPSSSNQSQDAEMEIQSRKREASCTNFNEELNDSADNNDQGDERPLLPPKTSAEMTVEGS